MKQSNRERQWARIRWVEFAYVTVMFAVLIGLFTHASFRPASDLVFWLVSGVTMLGGLGITVRQYQILDELGKLRFLKSWVVSGVVTVSSVAWTLWWAAYQAVKLSGGTQDGLPDLPADFIRIPSVSRRNRDSADSCTPRPEPVFLLLAPLGFPGIFNTFQSESVSSISR